MASTVSQAELAAFIARMEAQNVMPEGSPRLHGLTCEWAYAVGTPVLWYDNMEGEECAGVIVRRAWRLGWPRIACYVVWDGARHHLQLESALTGEVR